MQQKKMYCMRYQLLYSKIFRLRRCQKAYNIITMFAGWFYIACNAFTFEKISLHEIPSTCINAMDCQPYWR